MSTGDGGRLGEQEEVLGKGRNQCVSTMRGLSWGVLCQGRTGGHLKIQESWLF